MDKAKIIALAKELQGIIKEESEICDRIIDGTDCWTETDCDKVSEMKSIIDEIVSAFDEEHHRMVSTSMGEVMVKQSDTPMLLDCYIGDNYDQFIGQIEGDFSEDDESLATSVENYLI